MTNSITSFATIDGCRIEYQWHGQRTSDHTIVFLHEGLGSITQWRDFPASVCARTGWAGLVYNRRGYGGSDPLRHPFSADFMHREALDVLPRLLARLEIERPVLFGHSDGGSIALINAGLGADAPAALIVEAPHVFVEDITVSRIAEVKELYHTTPLRARLGRHHANVDRLFDAWTGVWLSDGFRLWSIADCLQGIRCPTLVIQGTDDEYGTLRQVAAIQAGIGRTVRTAVLDGCRHFPHVDRGGAVEDAVVAFVNELRATDGRLAVSELTR